MQFYLFGEKLDLKELFVTFCIYPFEFIEFKRMGRFEKISLNFRHPFLSIAFIS